MEKLVHIHNGNCPKPDGSLRFVCLSDTHSRSFIIPEGDVLIHAGDFTKKGSEEEVFEFANVLRRCPHRYKVIIAGNHDSAFDVKNYDKIISKKRIPIKGDPYKIKRLLKDFLYLEDSFVEIEGYKIWGTPWTIQHYFGAFTLKDRELLARKWEQIPLGIDIIVSHSPPFGILDRCRDNKSVGSVSLAEAVARVRPLLHIFGHIHEGHGYTCVDGITYINASICNNGYRPIYEPIVFDLPLIKI